MTTFYAEVYFTAVGDAIRNLLRIVDSNRTWPSAFVTDLNVEYPNRRFSRSKHRDKILYTRDFRKLTHQKLSCVRDPSATRVESD